MSKIGGRSKVPIIVTIILFIVMIVAFILFHVNSMQKVRAEYNQINEEMNYRLSNATRTSYKALADIPRGTVITEDLVMMDSNTLSDDSQALLMTGDDIGKKATIDINAGEIITSSMVTEALDKEYQEVEVNCVWFMTNQKEHDIVDVRIKFASGADYIIFSKLELNDLKLSQNHVFLWLTQDQIMLFNSAIVDANLNGGKIYTTTYVKPEIQKATVPTYQPTDTIIDLMNSDPNILAESKQNLSKAARASMEQRLEQFYQYYKNIQEDEEFAEGREFRLDETTEAPGIENPNGADNNGYVPDEEDVVDDTSAVIDSARNMEGYTETEGGGGTVE